MDYQKKLKIIAVHALYFEICLSNVLSLIKQRLSINKFGFFLILYLYLYGIILDYLFWMIK